jgi:hypothetical protein
MTTTLPSADSAGAPRATGSRPSPFVGLRAYAEEDAPFFFGRDRLREIITANLLASRLTLIFGPSGVGKSSVLGAAVTAHLRSLARREAAESEAPSFAVVAFSAWRDDPVPTLTSSIRSTLADEFGYGAEELPARSLRPCTTGPRGHLWMSS